MNLPTDKGLDKGNSGEVTDRGEEACVWVRKRRVCFATRPHHRQSCKGESTESLMELIVKITGRSRGISMERRLSEMRRYVRGWMGYFGWLHN